MINKKITLSLISIVAALSIMAGATFAYFSDVGTSNNNVFGAGTFDLKLSDDTPETDQDSVTASFGAADLAPGNCTSSQQLRVKNSGTVTGNHIEIAAVNNVTDVGTDASPDMDTFLRLDTFNYDGSPISVSNTNGNGFVDLDDLENNGVDNLALTNIGTNHTIDLVVCLDESAEDNVQGDSVDSDWTVTLNQNASQ